MVLARPLLASLIAGILSATGFAPLEWWPLTLACLALFLALVHGAPDLKSALLRGWLFGVGHFGLGNNWIQHAFDFQDKMPPVLGYFAVVLVAIYLAIYPAMVAGLAWRFATAGDGKRPLDAAYVLAAAAAWIVVEWLRAGLFTGYPWNPLGAIWLPMIDIARGARWIGTYALSGVTILVAGALLLLVTQRAWRFAAITTGAVALLALASHPFGAAPPPDARHVRVVQPDIGQDGVMEPGYAERVLRRLIRLTGGPSSHPRLVVWPEGMVNQYVEDGYPRGFYYDGDPRWTRARIATLLGPHDMALISGARLFFRPDGYVSGAGNTIFVLDPAARLGARYDKAHLVPFGEYLPLRTVLEPLGLARMVMGDIDFIPGPGPRTLAVPGFGAVGMQICYEIIFSGQIVDRAHRPALIFNPSNDAWFGRWGPPQHLAQARLRAIEEGLPILRATPTGISAVIDADGRLLATIPLGTAGAVEIPLPPAHTPTLFARLGNMLAFLVAGIFLVLAVAIRRPAR